MSGKKANNPEFLRKFIEIYQLNPALWKVKEKCYANRDLRLKGYQKLIELYKTIDPSATQETVRNKINNIRSAFCKELKKVKKTKKSGTSFDDVYVPSLWYYDLLLFTADQEESRNALSTLYSDQEEQAENEEANNSQIEAATSPQSDEHIIDISHDESSASTQSVPSRSQSRQSTTPRTASTNKKIRREDIVEAAYKNLTKEEDEFDAIGTTVAFKLRRMNENQRNMCEYLLNQLLHHGVKNQLEDTTYICFPPKPPNNNYGSHYNSGPASSAAGWNYDHQRNIPRTDMTPLLPKNASNDDENSECQLNLREYLKF